jgi:tape measure domain-containing protein
VTQVGSAEVAIFPTFKGFRSETNSEVDSVASEAGGKFSSVFGGAIKGIGAGIAVGVGAAIGAVATIAGKGLSRALNIQDAKAQLTGLGNSAEDVTAIMGNALDSVRGTAFGLDAAATIAASSVAAGIKPGEALTRTLKLTADAATIGKSSLSEMGDMVNKVATNGKLTTEVLQQFQGRGIPLLQMVADQYGVTAEAASEMVSKGEVDFATFQTALETGVGGAALSSGSTARGAFANIGAAFSRMGALFVGSAVDGAPTLFTSIAGAVDRATTAITPFAAEFSGRLTPAIAAAAAWIDTIDLGIVATNISSAFSTISGAVQSVMASFQGGDLAGPMDSIRASLTTLQPAFSEFGAQLPDIGAAAATLGAAVLPILTGALGFLADNVDTIIQFMPLIVAGFVAWRLASSGAAAASIALRTAELAAIPAQITRNGLRLAAAALEYQAAAATRASTAAEVTSTAAKNGGIVATIRAAASNVAARAAMVAGAVATGIATAAQWALNAAMSANPIALIVIAIAALVAGLIFFFTQTELGQDIWANFTQFLSEAWTNIVAVATVVFTALGNFFTSVWNGIVGFVGDAINNVRSVIITVVSFIIAYWTTYWNIVGTVFTTVWNAVSSFIGGIIGGIGSAISGFVGGVAANIEGAIGFVRDLPGKVLGFLGNMGSLLVSSGRALIQGFIDGIDAMIGKVGDAVGGVMDFVAGFFPNSPAQRGAFSGAGWRAVGSAGRAIFDEFESGIPADALQVTGGFAATGVARVASSAEAAAGSGDQPIYTDTGMLLGWIRRIANGEARLVWNEADAENAFVDRMGGV